MVPVLIGASGEFMVMGKGATSFKDAVRRLCGSVLHYTLGAVFWAYFKILCRGRVEGGQHISAQKASGFLIAANHVSYLDWVLLYLYFIFVHDLQVTFLAKDKVLNHWFWGPVVSKADCIRVVDGGGTDLVSDSRRRLLEQDMIVIFPEGTRSSTGKINRAKTGFVRIAMNRDVPIIPTALCGFYEAWPRHRALPRPHPLVIRFGAPIAIQPDGDQDRNVLQAHANDIMGSIARLKEEAV